MDLCERAGRDPTVGLRLLAHSKVAVCIRWSVRRAHPWGISSGGGELDQPLTADPCSEAERPGGVSHECGVLQYAPSG